VLGSYRPIIICEVLSNLIEGKLQEILTAKNYVFYKITSEGMLSCVKIVGDPIRVSNYLFIPKEKTEVVFSCATLKVIPEN